MNRVSNRRSLRSLLERAWLRLCLLAFLVSVVTYLQIGYFDFRKSISANIEELSRQSLTIERRISSELLAERTSVTGSVIEDLTNSYGLKRIAIVRSNFCGQPVCATESPGIIRIGRKLSASSTLGDYLLVEKKAETFLESLRLKYIFAVFAPVFLFFLFGIAYQRRILNQKLLGPVESLIGQSYRAETAPEAWPTEFFELSEKLQMAFRERDQAMIGQMASGVVHDIKTLFHSIGVAAELAEESSHDPHVLNQKLAKLLRVCQLQIPKIKEVIETVLDGNREIIIRRRRLDIISTLESVLYSTRDLASFREAKVEVNATNIVFSHDRAQLGRALLNIVKNSLEAIEANIPIKTVRISVTGLEDAVEISIEDSGHGFSFIPSFTHNSVRSTKTHGTGLGLLIAQKIIQGHGGSIRVEKSNALGGAKLTMDIPNIRSDEVVDET